MAPDIAPGQELKSIPDSLLEAICRTDNLLERICLDWWEMDHNQLESLLKAFPYLRHLQVAVSASMAKIVRPEYATSQLTPGRNEQRICECRKA